jgi:hydroxyacylglutathione hydrolase
VDPQRDCQIYIDTTQREGTKIEYIFETHRNEDYVIGSKELSHLTGALIYHGPWPKFQYGTVLKDGQEFFLGNMKVTAIYTPGHTLGCVSYSFTDLNSGNDPVLVCTGDTLLVNDVGRTDFGGPEKRLEWSENLYNSIYNKLLSLGDQVILCPAHGSGSVCGSKIAERELSTLGLERRMNPLLQKSKKEFIEYKVNEHHEYAPYFRMMEKLNVEGAPFVGFGPNPPPLKPQEFKEMVDKDAIVVDTRPPPSFGVGHIKGSYNLILKRLGLAGWVLPYDKPILLVLGSQKDFDYVTKNLMRLGYDNITGYLTPSIGSWYKANLPLERLDLMTVDVLKEKIEEDEKWLIIDVRSKDEWLDGHIKGSLNMYVGSLVSRVNEVPKGRKIAMVCKSGTRSSFASSILLRAGRKNIHNVLGGIEAWKNSGYPITTESI